METLDVITPVARVSTDPEGYLFQRLLASYAPTARAFPPNPPAATEVLMRLVELDIGNFDMSGSFDCSFWLQLSWQDMRLVWHEAEYDGSLRWPAKSVWTPTVLLVNVKTPDAFLHTSPVTITRDGWLSIEHHIQGTFTCDINSAAHPFSIHTCGIRIATVLERHEVLLIPT